MEASYVKIMDKMPPPAPARACATLSFWGIGDLEVMVLNCRGTESAAWMTLSMLQCCEASVTSDFAIELIPGDKTTQE
jgi:hypothetical protein